MFAIVTWGIFTRPQKLWTEYIFDPVAKKFKQCTSTESAVFPLLIKMKQNSREWLAVSSPIWVLIG